MPGEHLPSGIVIFVLAGHAAELPVLPAAPQFYRLPALKAEAFFLWCSVNHVHPVLFSANVAMHSRKCKNRKKINEKIYVSVKPQETAFSRKIQKIQTFSNDLHSETVKNIRKRINLSPEGPTAISLPFSVAYFALASGWRARPGTDV